MHDTIQMTIVRPEGVVFTGDVEYAICPGYEGQIGLLNDHTPILARIQEGEVFLRLKEGKEKKLEVKDGILHVVPDRAVIYTY